MDKIKFLNRFTIDEKRAILTASNSSVDVRLALFEMQHAGEVILTHQATIDFVNGFEAAGLLATGRAAQILNESADIPPNVHFLQLVSGTTFKCLSSCGQTITFAALGDGEPSVDADGNPPLNPEQWMGPCDAPN